MAAALNVTGGTVGMSPATVMVTVDTALAPSASVTRTRIR